jgi:putative tryptophan/tyrosine transport system substrate-binding protein
MTRQTIGLLVTLTLSILVVRIGLLITNTRSAESTSIEAFHRVLQAFGDVEGQNIIMEYRYADGNLD